MLGNKGNDFVARLSPDFAAQLKVHEQCAVVGDLPAECGRGHACGREERLDLGDQFLVDVLFRHSHGYYDGIFRLSSGKFRLGEKSQLTDYPVAMTDDPDTIRKRLADAAEERGPKSLRQLSLSLNRDSGYLNDFINKGSPRKLAYEDAAKLAAKLEIPPADLGAAPIVADEATKDMVVTPNSGRVDLEPGTNSFKDQPRDLKILGSARAGKEGFFLDQGDIQGMARRPPILQGIRDAFAVYVRDDSMVPAYEPGWVLHVHPHRPFKPNDNVIIELHDGQAFIKRLVRRTEKYVICKQWHPEEEVKYERSKVKSIMLVVGSSIEE